jgi:hypothetical protein
MLSPYELNQLVAALSTQLNYTKGAWEAVQRRGRDYEMMRLHGTVCYLNWHMLSSVTWPAQDDGGAVSSGAA